MHGHGPDYTNHLRPFAQVALVVGDFTNEQQQNLQRVERFPRQVATYIILRWWENKPESLELLFDCRLVSYVIGFIMFWMPRESLDVLLDCLLCFGGDPSYRPVE